MIKWKPVSHVFGILLLILGGVMTIPAGVARYYDEIEWVTIGAAAGITFFAGLILWFFFRNEGDRIGRREGFLIVAFGWVLISLFSALPYVLTGTFSSPIEAWFESVSGLSTTGASVMTDIESHSHGVLMWRSLTQWIGGMGIIVLTVAILPILGVGGVELFVAEAPGPSADKIHPRISVTAKRLWFIYLGLTVCLGIILYFLGMGRFDAINHAFTTMATGGFSTKNASVAFFASPPIEYVISLFMFIAGTNYTVIYFSLRGTPLTAMKSEEFRSYFYFILVAVTAVALVVFWKHQVPFEQAVREALFQVISIVTTTGFVTADYTTWTASLTMLFFFLLFVGGCAGSTSGGIKVIRHVTFLKHSLMELKRLIHPNALVRVKIDGKLVSNKVLGHIVVFLLWYVILFVLGSLLLAIPLAHFENPLLDSAGAVATALSNVGPAIGDLGPMDNFSVVPDSGKLILIALMILGRLEIFTVVLLFTKYFWKRN